MMFSHQNTLAASKSGFQFELQTTVNFRKSSDNKFAVSFPFPPEALPVGESSAFLQTVDSGKHFEVSNISLKGAWKINNDWRMLFKYDVIDLYDRNPTSGDQKSDLDIFLFRYGAKSSTKRQLVSKDHYFQIGKFEKFERQNDRHLQSYGLVSNAFNRFEDAGLEFGYNFNKNVYLKASLTTGNPVFIRDSNALAGDNGTDDRRTPPNNPDPKLKSGIVILYDAEIEHFNLSADPEFGLGLGYRTQGKDKSWQSDLLVWGYKRDLAKERNLHGTFYGADLDLLDGAAGFGLPTTDDKKHDVGANYWLYKDELTLFAQYVRQDLAGLIRTGKEIELSYRFPLPVNWVVAGKPFIKNISPAIRYSTLETEFSANNGFPAPSVAWDWKKVDLGFTVDFPAKVSLTFEYNINDFETKNGVKNNNELLISLNWKKKL